MKKKMVTALLAVSMLAGLSAVNVMQPMMALIQLQ